MFVRLVMLMVVVVLMVIVVEVVVIWWLFLEYCISSIIGVSLICSHVIKRTRPEDMVPRDLGYPRVGEMGV